MILFILRTIPHSNYSISKAETAVNTNTALITIGLLTSPRRTTTTKSHPAWKNSALRYKRKDSYVKLTVNSYTYGCESQTLRKVRLLIRLGLNVQKYSVPICNLFSKKIFANKLINNIVIWIE